MTATQFSEIELALTAAALNGDPAGLYRLATGLMDEGVAFDTLLFDYLFPAEREVGRRWQQGDYLVAEEHAATAAVETVISLLSGMLDQPTSATHVVVAAAEGDEHSLPGRAVAAYLLFLGYRTTFLGGSMPAADLRDFLEAERPEALVLSCAITSHLVGARSMVAAAHAVDVPVVVGGNAFGPEGRWAEVTGADAWVSSPLELPTVIDRWADPGIAELKGAGELPSGLVEVISHRSEIVARTETALEREESAPAATTYHDAARILLGAVEASLLVADHEPALEMIRWLMSAAPARGIDGDEVVTALLGVLEGSWLEAHDMLGAAVREMNSR
ncbi:MAG: cobalamin-dependent protein [Acidimicrobiia bacterium]